MSPIYPLDDDDVEQPGLLASLSDDDFEDLMHDKPTVTREKSDVQLRMCRPCREYAPTGSAAAGKCLRCDEPFVKPQHDLDARGGF